MSVKITDQEANLIIQIMGALPLSAFNTPSKKNILNKLLGVTPVINVADCIGEGDGAIFMLEDCIPGNVVETIKLLRAATGWGLKEAKDVFEKADPHRKGGVLGPFISSVPSFEKLESNLEAYQVKYDQRLAGGKLVNEERSSRFN